MKTNKAEKAFLTGCDKNTEWMLPWWLDNYNRHNSGVDVYLADFGMSKEMKNWAIDKFDRVFSFEKHGKKAWFLKPDSMIRASYVTDKTCWIDTDCEILGDITGIFDETEFGKLCMVCDRPWTKQRGSTWYNSGVVLFEGRPTPLLKWSEAVQNNPQVGDQEVLHTMIGNDPLTEMVMIKEIHNKYNWLRIQVLHKDDSDEKLIMHWTGRKGKNKIKKLIYG